MTTKAFALLAASLFLQTCHCFGEDDFDTMRERGLLGKISVCLTNSLGRQLEGIPVNFVFRTNDRTSSARVMTDEAGIATAEGLINLDVIVNVSSEGFYSIHHVIPFLTRDRNLMRDGRWLPWGRVFPLALRESRHPTNAVRHEVSLPIPLTDTTIGIDMSKEDLTPPYGKGTVTDICYRCSVRLEEKESRNYHKELTLLAFGKEGGFCSIAKDKESAMPFPYEYPLDGYEPRFAFSETRHGREFRRETFDDQAEFLAFKTKSRNIGINNDYNYGLIEYLRFGFDPVKKEGRLTIWYYLNETPGDRNSEYTR